MSKTPLTAEDLYQLHIIGQPRISHHGDRVIYVDKTIDQESHEKYISHLWLGFSDGNRPVRQLTYGAHKNHTPKWSPDDTTIAFISDRADEIPQVYLLPVDGGEAQQLTELERGEISDIEWSPDGTKLALLYAKSNQPADEDGKPKTPAVRRISTKWYKIQGKGFIDGEYSQIHVVNTETGESTQLTDTDFFCTSPNWTPDGAAIVFGGNPTESDDYDINDNRIYIQRLDSSDYTEIPKQEEGPAELPSLSPDGKTVAYVGHTDPEEAWGAAHQHLWLVSTDGSSPPRNVNPEFDRTIGNNLVHDMGHPANTGRPVWSPDGRCVYVPVSTEGSIHVYKYNTRSEEFDSFLTESGDLLTITFNQEGDRLACMRGDATHPPEVHCLEIQNGTWTQVSRANQSLVDSRVLVEPEVHWFDGEADRVQGWIMKPVGFDDGKKYPAVLEIHGGPRAMYGEAFFFEFQLLCAQGYAVFYCNPSGSQGYSEKFSRSITNDWGNLDYKDCMKATDFFGAFEYVDADRMVVTGGSYGGYMTNWIVGHTDRFQAAVTQRSVVNLESMAGTSDFGFADKTEFGGAIWDNPEGYRRMSPLTYVQDIHTPLLIIHSEEDLRCPVEQAEQLYSGLKMLDRQTELLRFPEETHELSRSGRPDRRVIRLQAVCDWFEQYLSL